MNETRSNSRTKQMRGDFKGGEMNSLKDSEKTNEYIKVTRNELIDIIYVLNCIITTQKIKIGNYSRMLYLINLLENKLNNK